MILDTNNKTLLECRVFPWYKHKILETTFVSTDNVVVVADERAEERQEVVHLKEITLGDLVRNSLKTYVGF
jgi:hypothetical protein